MKEALHKPPIPPDQSLVVKYLLDPYFDPNWHFHTEYQLFTVLEGSGTRFVGDNIAPFEAKEIVLTGPNLPHLWRSDERYFAANQAEATAGIVIYFREEIFGSAFLDRKEGQKIRHLLALSRRGILIRGRFAERLIGLKRAMLKAEGFSLVLALLEILHLISEAAGLEPIASIGYQPTLRPMDKEKLNRVQNYIFEHFRSGLNLEEAASIANMSPSAFSRYFKQRTHKRFSDFVSELRIGHACKLLLQDQWSISAVAYESGFNTLSNFNRQFKSITGKSPSAYRQTYAKWIN
ncbi:MAG: AraC family transcriptional regulator [Bacteroidota bacterium]